VQEKKFWPLPLAVCVRPVLNQRMIAGGVRLREQAFALVPAGRVHCEKKSQRPGKFQAVDVSHAELLRIPARRLAPAPHPPAIIL